MLVLSDPAGNVLQRTEVAACFIIVLRDMRPCSLVGGCGHYGETCCLSFFLKAKAKATGPSPDVHIWPPITLRLVALCPSVTHRLL
jgi:hypothetical protein